MKEEFKNYSLADFKKSFKNMGMVAKNPAAYSDWVYGRRRESTPKRTYTKEEVEQILDSGSPEAQIKLSRDMFKTEGFYKQIIIYYATLLLYQGIVIPETNPNSKVTLSTDAMKKRYFKALDYVDKNDLPVLFTHFAIRALRDGTYYGVLQEIDKDCLSVLDLPSMFCCTRFKDKYGNDIIEFDVRYFDTLDTDARKRALKAYPSVISRWYRRYKNQTVSSPWVYIPTGVGVCFPFMDDGLPVLLNVIPACMDLDEAAENELKKDADAIKKILTQHIPHLNDGMLVFEPPEAEAMHEGLVQMLKDSDDVAVATSYGDLDIKQSNTSTASTAQTTLDRMMKTVYAQAGVSPLVFSSDSNMALMTSILNDMNMMLILARKFEILITTKLNELFSNSNICFKYEILPVSLYNQKDYVDSAFKLASSGYSFLLPALGMGLSQKDLMSVKDLENELMDLPNKLIPLQNSYTNGGQPGEVGRPESEVKSEKTLQNLESMNNTGNG